MKKRFTLSTFLFLFLGLTLNSIAQTITAVSVSLASGATAYCQGGQANVNFTATGFAAATNFGIELSDAAGSFTTPVSLGTFTASPALVTIPAATVAGAGYKVRVLSGAVVTVSAAAFTVTGLPAAPTVTTPVGYCQNATATALAATGTALKWYTLAAGGTSAASITPATTAVGSTNYYTSQTVNGCEGPRATIAVNVTAAPAAPTASTPITYCQNAGASALSATGTALKWYTTASGGVSSVVAPTPSTAAAGTTNYYVSQTVGGCESARTTIAVNINALPAAPTASTPITYCQNAGASALSATGTALQWYSVASGGVASAAAPTPSTAAAGTTNYYVSQTVGGCESARTTISVNINALPAAPTASTPITYCQNAGASALSATGTALQWYSVASGGVASAAAPTPSTAAAGTTNYYVSQTVGGCESARTTITVNINALPTSAPSVATPLNICQGAIPSALVATPSASNSIRWYSAASGGSPLGSAPVPSTTVSANTTYTYYVTQVNANNCEYTPRTLVTVNVNVTNAPTITATIPVIECQGQVANPLSNAIAVPASGFSLLYYTAASGGSGSSTATIPSTSATGTTTYYVTQTNASTGCESTPRSAVSVQVNAVPTGPSVTSPVNICNGTTAISALSASASSGGSLSWWGTNASGGSPTSVAPTPSSGAVGTVTYYVSQTVASCQSSRVPINVVTNALPIAPAATSVLYCQSDLATAMTATPASGNSLKWYSGATLLGNSAPTPSTNIGTNTTYNYGVSQVTPSPAGCEGPQTAVTATVYFTPAPTITNPVYCQNDGPTPLTATGNSIAWYSTSSGGAALSGAPIPSATNVGTTSYFVTQRLYASGGFGGCENIPRATINVTVNPQPAAPSVTNPTYCQNYGSSPLSANGSSLKWYTVATGGGPSSTAPTPPTNSAGNTNFYVSQTNGFGCESLRASLTVTINPTPAQPGISGVAFCQNYPTTQLSSSAGSGNNLNWYGTNQFGGSAASTAPTPPSNNVGTFNYFVSQTNSFSCESPRATLPVTINPTPGAPAVRTPDIYCQFDNPQAIISYVDNGSNPRWYDGFNNALNGSPTPSTATPANLFYYVSQVNGFNCESPKSKIDVTVKLLPTAPNVPNTNYVLCQLDPTLNLSATGQGLKWYYPNGNISTDAPSISTGAGLQTSYSVSSLVNGCEGPKTKIDILIRTTPLPIAPTVPTVFCQQNGKFEPLPVTGNNLKWYDKPNGGTPIGINAGLLFTEQPGTYYYYVTQTNSATGCESPRVEVVGIIQPLPTATISGESSITQGQSATLKISFSGQGPWAYTLSNGFPFTATQNPVTVTVTPLETTVYTVTKVSNNCGNGTPIGSATINVKSATVQTGNPNVASLCAGTAFSIPFFSSDFIPLDAKYTIQISKTNDDATFQSIPTENASSPLKGTIPNGASGGSYFIRILTTASGFSLKSQVSPIQITVRELPTATISGVSAAIYEGETAKLSIALAGESPWTVVYTDSLSQQSRTQTLNASPFEFSEVLKTSNTYSIVSVSNGCGSGPATSKFRVKVSPLLSVGPTTFGGEWLRVYPMPVQSKCIIEIDGTTSAKPAQIQVLDILGRVSEQQNTTKNAVELDLSRLSSGTYIIRVEQNGRVANRKIMKID